MPDPVVPTPAPAAAPATPAPASPATPSPAPAPVAAPAPAAPAPATPAPAAPAPSPAAADPAAPAAPTAPQPAEVKLTLPAGSPLKQADVDAVQKLANEQKLTQPQAELLLQQRAEAATSAVENIKAAYAQVEKGYIETIKADPEMGHADANVFAAKMEHAKIGLTHLFTAGELEAFKTNGFGNAPWLVRAGLRHYQLQIQSPNLVNGQPIVKQETAAIDNSLAGWGKDLYHGKAVPGAASA